MNKTLQTHFAAIESQLQILVDSITAYNPSIPAAQALVAADVALTASLEDLATHQQLYNEILQTRARCDELEARIKETLETLAKTREEVVAAPATKFDGKALDKIDYEELLAYGKRLGRFHGPAMEAREALTAAAAAAAAAATTTTTADSGAAQQSPPPETQRESLGSSREPSKSVPPAPTISITVDGHTSGSVPPKSPDKDTAAAGLGARNLATDEAAWLDPEHGIQVFPWPSEERMRMGALAALQNGGVFAAAAAAGENGTQDVTMGDGHAADQPLQPGAGPLVSEPSSYVADAEMR